MRPTRRFPVQLWNVTRSGRVSHKVTAAQAAQRLWDAGGLRESGLLSQNNLAKVTYFIIFLHLQPGWKEKIMELGHLQNGWMDECHLWFGTFIIFPYNWKFHNPNYYSLHHFSEGLVYHQAVMIRIYSDTMCYPAEPATGWGFDSAPSPRHGESRLARRDHPLGNTGGGGPNGGRWVIDEFHRWLIWEMKSNFSGIVERNFLGCVFSLPPQPGCFQSPKNQRSQRMVPSKPWYPREMDVHPSIFLENHRFWLIPISGSEFVCQIGLVVLEDRKN